MGSVYVENEPSPLAAFTRGACQTVGIVVVALLSIGTVTVAAAGLICLFRYIT